VGDTSLAFLEEVEQPQQLNLWQSFMQSATSGIREWPHCDYHTTTAMIMP
jgi:hypothetical protein